MLLKILMCWFIRFVLFYRAPQWNFSFEIIKLSYSYSYSYSLDVFIYVLFYILYAPHVIFRDIYMVRKGDVL